LLGGVPEPCRADVIVALQHLVDALVDDGYQLTCTRGALIFDFAKPGTEPSESESGIE
jgi:hypothetical protein